MDINPTTNGENKLPAVDVAAKRKRENEIAVLEDRLQDVTCELAFKRYVHRIRSEVGR